LLIPIANNLAEHPVREILIPCDALVLLAFPPQAKELLVLGRSSNVAVQQAFFYSVEINPTSTHLRLGKTITWSNPSGRSHVMAKFSNDAKHVAISTGVSLTTGKAQIRHLSNVTGEWQEHVKPSEIEIIDLSDPESSLSSDCKGVMGLGLYNPGIRLKLTVVYLESICYGQSAAPYIIGSIGAGSKTTTEPFVIG
jgi:hypothetical protein